MSSCTTCVGFLSGGQTCAGSTCTGGTGCGVACYSTCADGNDGSPCSTLGGGGGSGCTCSGDCEGECTGLCGGECQQNCSLSNATDLYEALLGGLNKKIYAADMKNINDMLVIEANSKRRNKTITSVDFLQKQKASTNQINQIKSNLAKIQGVADPQDITIKTKIQETEGQEILQSVINLAKADIATESTGDS